MNQVTKIEEGRQLSPSQQFRVELDKMQHQFAVALPSHIKAEKFQRVVMTAVLSDPAVMKADRKSLMEAAIRAAQDGLLPDKREGAFVVFGNTVQWMPMVGGIIKRVHQSGDIKMLTARVVYGGDHFRTWIDDTGEHIEYEPSEEQDTSVIRRVFAMATTTDGAVYVEPLSAKDVEKIRNVSRSKNRGPWADWWEEMAKKSAIRRLAKRLPLSVDIHDLIQRDNGMYDLSQEPEARPSVMDRLKAAKNITPEDSGEREGFDASFTRDEPHDTLTGEILDTPSDEADSPPGSADAGDGSPDQSPEQQEAGSVPSGSASSTGRNPEMDVLIQFARDVLPRAADPSTPINVLNGIEKRWMAQIEQMSPEAQAKAEVIGKSMRALVNGKTSLDSALSYFSDVLDCSVEDLGGRADG